MPDLQELIIRGRFALADAPERLRLFELVNGKNSVADLAKQTKRLVPNVRRDLTMLVAVGLLQKRVEDGKPTKRGGFPIYEKVPLAKAISTRYFTEPAALPGRRSSRIAKRTTPDLQPRRKPKALPVPTDIEILAIANSGEDQTHEFKGQGTEPRKLAREVTAMLNTREGGLVLYGIDDEGNIEGSDLTLQQFDQPFQNALRNMVDPPPTVTLRTVSVMGSSILVVVVPPWDRSHIYQYDGKVLIRKGTNAFSASPDELRRLHSKLYVS